MREARAAVPLFAALGDVTRMQIVGRLSLGEPLSIATLTAGTGVTRQAVSKHLRVLDDAGLVRSNWHGRERLWELEPARLDAARRSLDLDRRAMDHRPRPPEILRRTKRSVTPRFPQRGRVCSTILRTATDRYAESDPQPSMQPIRQACHRTNDRQRS